VASSGLFSQILTFSSFGFMPVFSTPFFLTFARQGFLFGKKDVGLSLHDDEQLGAHSDLLCLESKKEGCSITITTTRYAWSHPGLKPFGNPLPIQCPDCNGLRTWGVLKKTADEIHLRCKADGCSNRLYFSRPRVVGFVLGKYVDDGRHGQWLKEVLSSETSTLH